MEDLGMAIEAKHLAEEVRRLAMLTRISLDVAKKLKLAKIAELYRFGKRYTVMSPHDDASLLAPLPEYQRYVPYAIKIWNPTGKEFCRGRKLNPCWVTTFHFLNSKWGRDITSHGVTPYRFRVEHPLIQSTTKAIDGEWRGLTEEFDMTYMLNQTSAIFWMINQVTVDANC